MTRGSNHHDLSREQSHQPSLKTQSQLRVCAPARAPLFISKLANRPLFTVTILCCVCCFCPAYDICGGDGGGGGGGGRMSSGMSAQCELFLRVLVEFWLEGNTVLRPGVLKKVRKKKKKSYRLGALRCAGKTPPPDVALDQVSR